MTIPNWVKKAIESVLSRKFYGKITISLESGRITHVRKEEVLTPPKG